MKNNNPLISVIIPTYNRSDMLKLTLDSFTNQNYNNYEIIIANNNSTDDTENIINEYVLKYENISTIFVRQQGAHYARNHAALKARGKILYFTDDDMIANVNLLTKLIHAFELDNRIGVVTGKIIPRFEEKPPAWVKNDLINGLLSLTDKNRKEYLIVSENDIGVYSCHQAIKKNIFFEAGGFNPDITAGVWIGDGETGLNIKIKRLGVYFAYTSESIIKHIIPAKRTTLKYLIYRIGNQGFCDAYTQFKDNNSKTLLLKNIFYKNWVQLSKIEIKNFVSFLIGRKNFRFLFAYPFYYLNKTKYEYKLLKDEKFKKVVLIDDWIKNIDEIIEFK